jgi:hypothetical protein
MNMLMMIKGRIVPIFISMSALATSFVLAEPINAGVTGYVTIHNSRNESVRVLVNWGFRGAVAAHESRSFLVGDDEDTTTWVTVETSNGYELKRLSYGAGYTDVAIWVD